EPGGQGRGPLQVDRVADGQPTERGAVQRLAHHVGSERPVLDVDHGQADPVDRDRVPAGRVRGDQRPAYGDPRRVAEVDEAVDTAQLLHDAGEHLTPPSGGRGDSKVWA